MPVWLIKLNAYFPIRYSVLLLTTAGCLLSALAWVTSGHGSLATLVFAGMVVTGVHDVVQTRRAILRNYPVIGHLRFLFEFIRPEIRQYFIESDNEAEPFSGQQRPLVYQRAKGEPDQRQQFATAAADVCGERNRQQLFQTSLQLHRCAPARPSR